VNSTSSVNVLRTSVFTIDIFCSTPIQMFASVCTNSMHKNSSEADVA
jgi:hypothetical protein